MKARPAIRDKETSYTHDGMLLNSYQSGRAAFTFVIEHPYECCTIDAKQRRSYKLKEMFVC